MAPGWSVVEHCEQVADPDYPLHPSKRKEPEQATSHDGRTDGAMAGLRAAVNAAGGGASLLRGWSAHEHKQKSGRTNFTYHNVQGKSFRSRMAVVRHFGLGPAGAHRSSGEESESDEDEGNAAATR